MHSDATAPACAQGDRILRKRCWSPEKSVAVEFLPYSWLGINLSPRFRNNMFLLVLCVTKAGL